jgi:hypothetical protein
MLRAPAIAAAALCSSLALSGCIETTPTARTAGTELETADPMYLVAAIRNAGTLADATAATHAVFFRSGIAVVDREGTALGPPVEAAAPYHRTSMQLVTVAAEARANQTRLTLQQTAILLELLGFSLSELADAVEQRRSTGTPSQANDGQGAVQNRSAQSTEVLPTPAAPEAQEALRALEQAEREIEVQLREVPPAMRAQVRAQIRASKAALNGLGQSSPSASSRERGGSHAMLPAPSDAGMRLASLLRSLVLEARDHPDDPRNWPIQVLEALASTDRPATDLGSVDVAPDRLHWGLLELELLTAALVRGSVQPALAGAPTPRAAVRFASLGEANPCGKLKQALSGLGAVGATAQWGVNQAGGEIASAFIDAYGPAGAGEAIDKLQVFSQLIGLAEFYALAGVHVEVLTESPTHKVVTGESPKQAKFRARAGIDPEVTEEYEELMRSIDPSGLRELVADCGPIFGIPTFDTPSGIADQVKDWRIDWDIDVQPEGLATWKLADNDISGKGRIVTPLQMGSPGTGVASFTMDIGEEERELHERKHQDSHEKTGFVRATAKVKSSKPPSVDVIMGLTVGALTGNVVAVGKAAVSGVVEMSTGLVRELVMPKSHAILEVTYHERPGYEFDTNFHGAHLYGTKCGNYVGTWRINMAGKLWGMLPIHEGYLWATIEKDGSGSLHGDWRIRGLNHGGIFLKGRYFLRGTAEFDWQAQQLKLTITNAEAAGEAIALGQSLPFQKDGAGSLDILVPVRDKHDACR